MRILIGITAGIAAYKIPFLIRHFIKAGAEVKCIMTPASSDFISPLVLSTLSKNPVGIEFWNTSNGVWNNHVEYGEWADVFLIAPATANTLQKMAQGACDNLLLATYLSMRSRTIVAPAMDLDMYQHPAVKRNLNQLIADGVIVIPATVGELASGLAGEGRMEEPEQIFEFVLRFLNYNNQSLSQKKVLITAGPTYEPIDPVRFIGNHSTGKMGFALAEVCANRGAQVVLVAGPNHLKPQSHNIELISVQTADDMFEVVKNHWETADIGIFSAAVADYKPLKKEEHKIKKHDGKLNLELTPNPDILNWAGHHKKDKQIVVGFALESNNEKENALEKLHKKKASFIVLNSLKESGAGFGGDTNKVTIFGEQGECLEVPLKSKKDVASAIMDFVILK